MKNKGTVALGMSGGVDSSVSAYLLKKEGYDVIGVTFKLWHENEHIVYDAMEVCKQLEIPLHVMDMEEEFKSYVIEYFIDEYMKGRTPNPCVVCNKKIKFNYFLKKAKEIGADFIATGHYAIIDFDEDLNKYILKKGIDPLKDQTYFLYNLTQNELKQTLFPLGNYTKDKIKQIANEIGLKVAQKPESQEICFIPDNDYRKFLRNNVDKKKFKKGKFMDLEGNVLGTHEGIPFYTIGQRKGLGLSLGSPVYVNKIDAKKNAVLVGSNDRVFQKSLICVDNNFIFMDKFENNFNVEAKIRYGSKPSKATVFVEGEDKLKVVFDDDQRAITPGQAVVFYEDDVVLGGGTIIDTK